MRSIKLRWLLCVIVVISCIPKTEGQMRQIYADMVSTNNNINKISFYSPSAGYIASTGNSADWVGHTLDSGRTITKRFITLGNVNYNGYSVNLTFGFGIHGVKAFGQDTLLAYGDYGLVPSILYSTNGGLSYLLVYHSQVGPTTFSTMFDMIFPQNDNIGFAADGFRILKTTNRGQSWSLSHTSSTGAFGSLDAIDNNNVFAFSNTENVVNGIGGGMAKTTNGGNSWTTVVVPYEWIRSADFITPNKGWVNINLNGDSLLVYYTSNGGSTWTKKNHGRANPIGLTKMQFINDSTGYGIGGLYSTFITTDSGKVWEPLPRDNNFEYLGFSHNDMQLINNNQFWCGGGRDFLEITTNGGGTPIPKAYFIIDTSTLYNFNTVNLYNYSKPAYTHQWFRNNVLIGTTYNMSYQRDPASNHDSIKLVVSNGTHYDTLVLHQYFWPPVDVTSFNPTSAGTGTVVTISGSAFTGATAVRFGGVPAASFTVVNATTINATVGAGASGVVKVMTPNGQDSLAGFTYLPPPTISSFAPTAAAAGTLITITGTNFSNVTLVTIGGISVSFTVVSPTTITAAAPSGPSGSIVVTTTGGIATATGYSSLPTITSFTPAQGTHGTILHITGTSLSGATGVSIGGINATSFTVNSPGSITAVVGAGGTGNVVVVKPAGSSSLPFFTWRPPPVITSFTPTSGPVGTVVTITGTGFNTTPASNTVFFGAMQATITGATATSLTVIVPNGATFNPISVTNFNLMGYSAQPFLVTFANGGSITPNAFATNTVFGTGSTVLPFDVDEADFDGDGKADIALLKAVSPGGGHGVSVYRNTSSGNTISFATPIELAGGYETMAISDLDGDGKLDIAVGASSSVLTYRNTSTPGNLSFVAGAIITTGDSPQMLCITDFDGDGKTDLLCNTWPASSTKIFRNISEPGVIAFNNGTTLPVGSATRNTIAFDIDGDKKPEIVVSGSSVLKNNSTPDNISFAAPISIPGFIHSYIASGDMDGDGKTDIVSGDLNGSTVAVLRNTSTASVISFEAPVSFPAVSSPSGIGVSDLDGDGKLDVAAGLMNNRICIFKNTSTPGTISLAPKVDYVPGSFGGENLLTIGDMNNDGKNDVVVISEVNRYFAVHVNDVKPEPFVQSFTPTTGVSGTIVNITGANFTGVTAVSFGGVAAISFIVNSPTSITATVGTGASGAVAVTNNFGTGSLAGFVYGTSLSITNVAPLSGPVGTTVTITGTNFNPVAANNIVYFGAAKTIVLSASATTITVAVPFGSMYQPISVTTGGLVAHSSYPFTTTFPGGTASFNANSFAARIDLASVPYIGTLIDADGDGKLDIAGAWGGVGFGIARNTSITGNISFAPTTLFATTPSVGGSVSADFDGDGRHDLAFTSGTTTMSVFRNLSTAGNISFGPRTDYLTGVSTTNPSGLTARDVDADGKVDILVSNYSVGTIAVFKNTSTGSTISFGPRIDYSVDGYANDVETGDLDGDRKPEIVASSNGSEEVSIFRNTSITGTISYAPKIDLPAADWPSQVNIGDLDNDAKSEIIISNSNAGNIFIFKNNSTTGNLSFAGATTLTTTPQSGGNTINDLNGDGKPEIITVNNGASNLSVFANNSSTGTIAFLPKVDYDATLNPGRTETGDLDGDGKADIIIFHSGAIPTVLRNQSGSNGPIINSFSPVSAIAGATITITGSNFTGATAVSFGGTPAASFSVVSSTIITAVLGTGATGTVVVTTPSGTASLTGFVYGTGPVVVSVAPMLATPGTSINITGANFTGTTAVSFGGTAASSFIINSSTSISAILGTGSSGYVKVVTPIAADSLGGFVHVTPPTITSFSPTSAGGGATVTITGTNFTGAASVTFGGTAASSFTVVSPTTITAIVGNGVAGNAEVKTPGGTASLAGFHYLSSPGISSFFPTSGPTGTTILITGFNIASATAVSFGGTPASSFTVTSPSTISAVVGAGASGSVSLTNPTGPASLAGFTYISGITPGITYFTPTIGTTGTVVTITGYNFTGATAVSFGGTAASSFTVISPTTITATVSAGTSGNVSITTPGGNTTIPNFTYINIPFISSFTPLVGRPGSAVTITGSNFSPVAANNIVYFGNVKAVVNTASATSLSVSVPNGSVYSPISVTVSGLTAYSIKPFLPTFNGVGGLGAFAFIQRTDSISNKRPSGLSLADVDIDGKPDLSIANAGASPNPGNLTIFRNTATTGTIAFAPKFMQTINYAPGKVNHVDLNGDGKLDLFTSNGSDLNAVLVLPNNSTAGSVSFGTPILLSGGLGGFRGTSADFNADGKPDIAFFGNSSSSVSVYANTTSGTTISFAAAVTFGTPMNSSGIFPTDIDGDGKIDLIITGGTSGQILRNTTTGNTITFTSTTLSVIINSCKDVIAGDLDGDGKPDIIMTQNTNNRIMVLKNNSMPGYLTFGLPQYFSTGQEPNSVTLSDIDGDGKVDVVVSNNEENNVSVLTNNSVTGQINFNTRKDFALSSPATFVVAGDMDGDERPEIILANPVSHSVSVLKNLHSVVPYTTVTLCANASTNITSGVTGSTYQWQQNTGSGFTNVSNGPNLSGTNIVTLQLINVPASWNNYEFRCLVNGSLYSETFKLFISTPVAPAVSISTGSTTVCAATSVTFTATPTNGGTNPTYQWQVSGINAGTNSSTFTTSTLTNGAQVKVIMTSNANCSSPATATSNTITMTITPTVTPSVTISASATTICPATSVTFTATPVNGGTAPSYQWQVNGINAGTNSNTFTTSSLVNNDQVKVILTSNANCASPATATSNTITMTVGTVTPGVSISASATTICPATSITFTATPTNGGSTPSYQWQVNGVNAGTNSNTFTTSSLVNNDQVKVIITSSSGCASPPTATSNTITITVSTTLVPAVSISASATTICPATSVTFTATPTNGGSTPSYQWQVNGVNAGTNSNTFTTGSLANNDQVKVILTSNATCASPATATSNAITITVNATVVPSVSIISSANPICQGASVTFTATPVNGGSNPSYQWQVDGSNAGTNSNIFTTSSLTVGNHTVSVTLTSNATCVSPTTATQNISIAVNATATPSVSINGTTTVLVGQNTTLTATPVNGGTPSYQWQDSTNTHNWQNIAGATSSSHVYTPALTGDKVRCFMTSNANCASPATATSNALSFIVNTVTAVNPVPGTAFNIRAYPNPVHTILYIDSLKLSDKWQTIQLISMDGKQMISPIDLVNKTKKEINVEKLLPGHYIIVLRRKSGAPAYLKLIKL